MKKLCVLIAAIIASFGVMAGLASCKTTNYDLVYASWNLGTEAGNNIERQMIKAFEEKYEVKVKIEENISLSAYDDSIRALAIKNSLPDVFMLSNINFGLSERYVSDISDLIAADTTGDWDNIPKPVEEAVHYKSGIYAVPFAMHMMGYFVNVDLLEQYGLDGFLDGEITWDSFYNVVKEMANYKNDGVIGLSHEGTLFEWYPSSQNSDYGWFTWDGSQYHLDSDEFKDAIRLTKEFRTNGYTYDGLSEEERALNFEGYDGYTALWNAGKLAIRWGATYEVPDMIDNSNGFFDIRFIGVPGGRTPMVGDYLAISNTCKNRDLAYKFAKWMSFDPNGIKERISRDNDVTNTLPLTIDSQIVADYFDKFTAVSGIEELYETLDNGIVEAVKVVPGYNRARWLALTGISLSGNGETIANANIGQYIDACWTGLYDADYSERAAALNTLANQQYSNVVNSYSQYYN